jgi:ubiquinone/menaquinone biosynthesis C-methylase UbiE
MQEAFSSSLRHNSLMPPLWTQRLYSSIARFYDVGLTLIGYRRTARYVISRLSFAPHEKLRILDAGCGTGLYATAAAQQFPTAQIVAFDLNERMTNELKKKVERDGLKSRTHVFTGDILGELPELKAPFDLIITGGVLEYVPMEEAVKNLARFLRPGGIFMNVPVRNTFAGRVIGKIFGFRPYEERWLATAFEQNGFFLEDRVVLRHSPVASFKEAQIWRRG